MMMVSQIKFSHKHKKILRFGILLLITIALLLVANQAQAGVLDFFGGLATKALAPLFDFGIKLVSSLMQVVFTVFGWLLGLAGLMLDFVLTRPELQQFTKATIVKVGWETTRNLANMFFALILMVISFATILRVESYGVKQVLPKLIIAALLINFSLVIAGVIIDFTQVLTKYFVDAAKAGSASSISATIMKGLKITEGFDPKNLPTLSSEFEGLINTVIALFAGIIVILVAALTFFAAAIFLIVRLIALWFLLILAPLAWLFYILPATRGYWNMWWSTFFKWAFFAPAYAFFLYLGMMLVRSGALSQAGGFQGGQLAGISPHKFGGFTIQLMISYVIIIGFFWAALLVAQKAGVAGAGAAISIGKSGGNWMKRQAMRPTAAGYYRGAAAMTGLASKLAPGFIGRRLEAKAKQLREKRVEAPEHQAYRELLSRMSQKDTLAEASSAMGVRRLIATQEAQKRGLYKDATAAQVSKAAETLQKFGRAEDAEKLQESRPDMLETPEQVGQAVAKAISTGKLNEISHVALEDDRVVEAICKLATAKQIQELVNKSQQHKDALTREEDKEKGIKAGGLRILAAKRTTDSHDEKDVNFRIQMAFASQTGDISNLKTPEQKAAWAKLASPEGLKKLKAKDFDKTVVENIPAHKLRKTLEEMEDGELAEKIAQHLRATPTAAGHEMAKEDPYLKNLGK